MQIIKELEAGPRGIYTGAIGYVTPGPAARFNVAIRTVVIDEDKGCAEYGVGGGIVWDSEGQHELSECLDKARVLTAAFPDFSLLETMLWTPENGFYLLARHLKRLSESAEYFGFTISLQEIERALQSWTKVGHISAQRVRLLVDHAGAVSIESADLITASDPERGIQQIEALYNLRLAKSPINSQNPFLYHKTTHRIVYEQAKQQAGKCYDDVILYNERGEVTETCIGNIVVNTGGVKLTPPVECGLLAGTFRAHLIESGQVSEKSLSINDLRNVDDIYVINSVRGWIKARIL